MYRRYISSEEYNRIVNDASLFKNALAPHCNQEVFHEPKICCFCDGYYNAHPGFEPIVYDTPEANGWGGNQAPVVDDALAAEEEKAMNDALSAILKRRNPAPNPRAG